jgi:hypothetical protein
MYVDIHAASDDDSSSSGKATWVWAHDLRPQLLEKESTDPNDPPRQLEIKATFHYEWPGYRSVSRKLTLQLTPADLSVIARAAIRHGLFRLEEAEQLKDIHQCLGRVITLLDGKAAGG